MLARTSGVVGFGYEVALMRKYQELARGGASWLIVFAPEPAQQQRVTDVNICHGALMAAMVHRLVIEDLI